MRLLIVMFICMSALADDPYLKEQTCVVSSSGATVCGEGAKGQGSVIGEVSNEDNGTGLRLRKAIGRFFYGMSQGMNRSHTVSCESRQVGNTVYTECQ